MITGSSLDYRLRIRIAERAIKLKEVLDNDLALMIVNRLAESLSKG
jgi:hypothetical protein